VRLRVDFGTHGARKEITWWNSLEDFPPFISYNGKKYEFLMYDRDPSGQVDYTLLFTEIPTYDPNFYSDMPSWETLFGTRGSSCECGAIYTSFPWDHMRYCSLWRKW
jgi:hypothetical protein